ncbi:MAG: signal peptidase II [Tissierellia bacterium]|nr:signal peptidase II [Tissierellia bacterium]
MYIIIPIILLILDQATKFYAISHFKGQEMLEIIPNWLYFTYVENRGAAFGLLNDKPWFFTIVASVFVITMTVILLKNRNNINSFYSFSIAIIIVGALGNLIDRLLHGYVVDFIYSPLNGFYSFPVFNLADAYLTVMAIVLGVYIFFIDGDSNVDK